MTNSPVPDSARADKSRSPATLRRALGVTAIAFVCLGVWALSPIYPDEIAFRQELGRVIADHGVVYGLFEMCPSNIKTVPLAFKPVVRRFGPIGLIAGVAPFVLFVPPGLKLHHFVCTEHPEIEAFVTNMGFNTSGLGARHLALLLLHGAQDYVYSFGYVASYPIHFLPGVHAGTGPTHLIQATNMLISLVIAFVGGLAFCIPVAALFRCIKLGRFRPGSLALFQFFEKNPPFVIAALITVPVVLLFVYDPRHAFYRNSYLNHFISVAACLVLASSSGRVAVRVTKGACSIIGITVGASLILNAVLFVPPLLDGYAGPSVSAVRNWPQVAADTDELARLCKMDLQRGRIVVDDLTQAGVFSRQVTIPVTYVGVQASSIGISVHDAVISLKPNYAILRCPYFDILGFEPQGKIGEICCYTFN